ncbi:MAG: histidine kinase dimerization/phospho-acceptor domain-containing protein, partial [Planctomycetota bacterium]
MADDRNALLDMLNPFHLLLRQDWTIERVGPALAEQLGSSPVGQSLDQIVRIKRPALDHVEWLRERLGQIIVLELVRANLRLRGQLVSLPDGDMAFLGAPWITSLEELTSCGLSLDRLAPHDSSGDYILLLSAMREQAADLERIVRSLEEKDRRLRESEEEARRLSIVAARTVNAVILTDARGIIEWVNDGFRRLTGYTLEEAKGLTPGSLLQGPGTNPATVRFMGDRIRRAEGFTTDVLNYSKSGEPYWVHVEVQPIHDESGALVQFMAVETDITRHVRQRMRDERLQQLFSLAQRTVSSLLADENLGVATMDFLSALGELLRPDRIRLLVLEDRDWAIEAQQRRAYPAVEVPALSEAERRHLAVWAAGSTASCIRDVTRDGLGRAFPHSIADDTTRGLLAVPVMTATGCEALIVLETSEAAAEWGEEEMSVLLAVAQGVARAIEHRSVAQQLRNALETAQVATREKTSFLANMSHEIRTPMMAIVGHAQLLSRQDLTPDQRSEWSVQLRRSADHLLALVNNVLDISKIESGGVLINESESELALVVSDAVSLVRPQVAEKGVDLETRGAEQVPARVVT